MDTGIQERKKCIATATVKLKTNPNGNWNYGMMNDMKCADLIVFLS